MENNIDDFDLEYFEAGSTGVIVIEDVMCVSRKQMVSAVKDVGENITIRIFGFGDTEEEALNDVKNRIDSYFNK
jgi:hypothetical protein